MGLRLLVLLLLPTVALASDGYRDFAVAVGAGAAVCLVAGFLLLTRLRRLAFRLFLLGVAVAVAAVLYLRLG